MLETKPDNAVSIIECDMKVSSSICSTCMHGEGHAVRNDEKPPHAQFYLHMYDCIPKCDCNMLHMMRLCCRIRCLALLRGSANMLCNLSLDLYVTYLDYPTFQWLKIEQDSSVVIALDDNWYCTSPSKNKAYMHVNRVEWTAWLYTYISLLHFR